MAEAYSSGTGAEDRQSTDIVICGAGPTGLLAAGLLARCGVRVRLFDKTDQQAHESGAFWRARQNA
jgi:2-polyprenyl-6-methoxyphenol hydroxylase-like FAD-dependent oxidoreductase